MKYLCYDSALNEEYTLIALMKKYPHHISLFTGTDDEGIWDAAPWLFELTDNVYELQHEALIQLSHCVIFETGDNLKNVCDFLHTKMYRQKNSRQEYYRIWDARVMIKYLNECDVIDRQSFFQVFDAVYTEADSQHLYKWLLQAKGKISNTLVSKSEALPVIKNEEPEEEEIVFNNNQKEEGTQHASLEQEVPKEDEVMDNNSTVKRRKFFID